MSPHSAISAQQQLPFMTFAFVASITPGPSNLLVLGNSARYGFVAALPIVGGACIGAAALVLVVGLGIGGWLVGHPQVQAAMTWAGALWMSFLAWQIASQPAERARPTVDRPTGAVTAAILQIVNPKTWGMALAVIGVFAGDNPDMRRYALLSGIFLLVSLPCLAVWAVLGSTAGATVRSGAGMKAFNTVLGTALFGSAWFAVWERG